MNGPGPHRLMHEGGGGAAKREAGNQGRETINAQSRVNSLAIDHSIVATHGRVAAGGHVTSRLNSNYPLKSRPPFCCLPLYWASHSLAASGQVRETVTLCALDPCVETTHG